MLTLKRIEAFPYSSMLQQTVYLDMQGRGPLMVRFPMFASSATGVPSLVDVGKYRVPGETRWTGKAGLYNCHDCRNHQIKATYVAGAYDYSVATLYPGLQTFDVDSIGSHSFPGVTQRLPSNGLCYTSSETDRRVYGMKFNNPVGQTPTPGSSLGDYSPVLNGTQPSSIVMFDAYYYVYWSDVTRVLVHSVQPVYRFGRVLYLVSSCARLLYPNGTTRQKLSEAFYLMCPTAVGFYYYDGTSWRFNSGSGLPTSLIGSLTDNGFLALTRDPACDPLGILAQTISDNGLPQRGVDSHQLGSTVSSEDAKPAMSILHSAIAHCKGLVPVVSDYDWSDLCDTAVDNCHAVNINNVANISEFLKMLRDISSVVHGDLSAIPRSLEDLWLTARFGIRLTVSDFKTMVKAVLSNWPETSSGSKPVRVRARTNRSFSPDDPLVDDAVQALFVEIFYKGESDKALSIIRNLMDWGVWPTLANDWDLIPYSFVVDWVADIGRALGHLDRMVYEEYINILVVLYTDRTSLTLNPGLLSLPGLQCTSCEYVSYVRRQSPTALFAPLRVQRGHSSAVNAVDAVSLVVQRGR